MTTEKQEHTATLRALNDIHAYIAPGTNEGISWTMSRLTLDLFGDSFTGGGDASLFTPSGKRGSIASQESNTFFIMNSASGNVVQPTSLSMTFDLNDGVVSLKWIDPSTGSQSTATFTAELSQRNAPPGLGVTFVFGADSPSDGAGYSLVLALL
jgi:hypothetical protein